MVAEPEEVRANYFSSKKNRQAAGRVNSSERFEKTASGRATTTRVGLQGAVVRYMPLFDFIIDVTDIFFLPVQFGFESTEQFVRTRLGGSAVVEENHRFQENASGQQVFRRPCENFIFPHAPSFLDFNFARYHVANVRRRDTRKVQRRKLAVTTDFGNGFQLRAQRPPDEKVVVYLDTIIIIRLDGVNTSLLPLSPSLHV